MIRIKPSYSIIVPAFNSYSNKKRSIELVAKCLANQRGVDIEVFFIANDSSDGTLPFLKRFTGGRDNFHLIETPMVLPRSAARNCGASYATGEWLLFMDDDCMILDDSVLSRVYGGLVERDWAVGARRKWLPLGWNFEEIDHLLESKSVNTIDSLSIIPSGIKRGTGRRDLHEFSFVGHFGIVKNELFRTVGGYDEEYVGWGYEDTDLMLRLYLESNSFLNMFDKADVFHLTHPITKSDKAHRSRNIKLYQAKEAQFSVCFYVNRLFGVFDDGKRGPVLEKRK